MELNKILSSGKPIADVIEELKKKTIVVPKWSDLVTEYDPELHEVVTNEDLRKDKVFKDGKTEPVARVTYGQQKLIAKRMTQMAFSIPVKRNYKTGDDPVKKEQAKAIEQVYNKARIDSENIKRMKAYFASCEIATIWYVVQEKNRLYGFDSEFKLKCRSYSPMEEKYSGIEQANLFPLLNKYRGMEAMSFSYTYDGVEYFETYTRDKHYCWKYENNKWSEVPEETSEIVIRKHPLIYLWRTQSIWESTTRNTQEIELTLSRESDIIRKNSAPIIKVKGKLLGNGVASDKAREVYQLEGDGDVAYVTWQQQIEAMKFYINTLKQNTEEELQLPNLSMENVKSLGAISGEARKTLLTDAHLKVGDEKGDIIEFLDRECNVIKAFLGQMNKAWENSIDDLEVEHIITPFIQNDEASEIDKLSKATGGKAIISQEEGIARLGWSQDPKVTLQKIQSEEASAKAFDLLSLTA